jgi:hypothetical protein
VVAKAIEDATASSSKKRSRQDNSKSLVDLFGGTSKDAAGIAIAELFFACGIPFRVSLSDFYKRAIKAIQAAPPGYHGPGSDKLSTDLLDTCKLRCKDALQPCFEQHAHTGATVCSDGWGNIAREHLINIMVTSPKEAFRVRWDTLHTPMHAAAYALDPEFWDVDVFSMPEIMEGLDISLERL